MRGEEKRQARPGTAAVALLLAVLLVMGGCGGAGGDEGDEAGPVRLLTHEAFPLPESLLDDLERELGAPVAVVVEKDAASMVELLTASSAPAAVDVVVGLDSLSVGSVLDAGLFAPYSPAAADHLEPTLRLGDDVIVPMSWTDVCFNFDKFWFEPPEPSFVGPRGPGEAGPGTESSGSSDTTTADGGAAGESGGEAAQAGGSGDGEGDSAQDAAGGPTGDDGVAEGEDADVEPAARPDPPSNVESLTLEPYRNLVAMADPATDRFSLAFVAGLAGAAERSGDASTSSSAAPSSRDTSPAAEAAPTPAADPGLVEVLRGLRANGLAVTDSFQTAYFGEFTAGSSTGTRPLVLASALMPAVSVRLVDPLPQGVQTAVINDQCARLVDYSGVLADAPNPRLARRLMDLLVGPEFQFELSDARGSQPARTDLIRRPEVAAFGIAVQPVLLDPFTTAARVPALMAAWTEAGLTGPGTDGTGSAPGGPGVPTSGPADVATDG